MSDTHSSGQFPGWHGTTIIGVKKGGEVVIAGDGQVSLGQTVIKGSARKVRRLSPGGHDVVCGFAGSTADALPCWNVWRPNWKPRPVSWRGRALNWPKTGAQISI